MLFNISHVKVNGYMFRGSNLAIFIFASLFNGDKSRKEFAPKGANSFLKELLLWNSLSSRETYWKSLKLIPFIKMPVNKEVYSHTLKQMLSR